MTEPFSIEPIVTTMLNLERKFHSAGWDNDKLPILASLDLVDKDALAFASTPLRPTSPVGMWLMGIARLIAEDTEVGPSLAKTLPELYGFAMIAEHWASDTPMAQHKPGQGHADMPDGNEVRSITAVDRHGRVFYVWRVRGNKPELWHSEMSEEEKTAADIQEVVGGVPEGLRRLLLAILRYRDGETEESLNPLSSIQLLRERP